MKSNVREAEVRTFWARTRWAWRLGLGLSLTPGLALTATWAARITLPERSASALAFGGGALLPVAGLAIAASVLAPTRVALTTLLASLATWALAVGLQPPPAASLVLFDTALVALAWAFGDLLGQRVQHEAHLLPACAVASSADLLSVLSPEGPSHAIVTSDRALSALAIWFPVPGTRSIAPALGVGDLLFVALVFAVARQHCLPYSRCVAACLVGTALAGFGSAWLAAPVPALIPISAVLVLGVPGIRRLRSQDRTAAGLSMAIAAGLAFVTVARALLG